jgi:hypothetical protein
VGSYEQAALTLTTGLLLSATALSASRFGFGILHERNLFYATPLVLVCVAHWLAHGLDRPRMLVVAVALAAIALPPTLPEHVVEITDNVDRPTAAWLNELKNQVPSVPTRGWTVGIVAVGAVALLLIRGPLVPILAVVLSFVAMTGPLDYSGALTPEQDQTQTASLHGDAEQLRKSMDAAQTSTHRAVAPEARRRVHLGMRARARMSGTVTS